MFRFYSLQLWSRTGNFEKSSPYSQALLMLCHENFRKCSASTRLERDELMWHILLSISVHLRMNRSRYIGEDKTREIPFNGMASRIRAYQARDAVATLAKLTD